jgi:hypothetical protein
VEGSIVNVITYDTFLEQEEFITAAEYLRRRKRGEINPMHVRVVLPDLKTGNFGGFAVRLETPRYRILAPRRSRRRFGHGR